MFDLLNSSYFLSACDVFEATHMRWTISLVWLEPCKRVNRIEDKYLQSSLAPSLRSLLSCAWPYLLKWAFWNWCPNLSNFYMFEMFRMEWNVHRNFQVSRKIDWSACNIRWRAQCSPTVSKSSHISLYHMHRSDHLASSCVCKGMRKGMLSSTESSCPEQAWKPSFSKITYASWAREAEVSKSDRLVCHHTCCKTKMPMCQTAPKANLTHIHR